MIRYTKQRDKFSCGPVAIMNAVKWTGSECTYAKRIGLFRDLCLCRPVSREPDRLGGTSHANFDQALRRTAEAHGGFDVLRVYRPKLPRIEEHLRSGGIIIMNYYWEVKGKVGRHFCILESISDSGKTFRTVNDVKAGPAIMAIRRRTFVKGNLRFQRSDPHYKAWFLTKRLSSQ